MTWLKLGDEFPKECRKVGLSDSAFRLHVEGLCYSMDDENGGRFTDDDVAAFSRAKNRPDALSELASVGFWQRTGQDSWQIIHSMGQQPDPETLAARRDADLKRQNRLRRKKAGLPADPVDLSRRDSTRDEGRDITRDPARTGTGRGGSGQGGALEEGESVPSPRAAHEWCMDEACRLCHPEMSGNGAYSR